MKRFYFLLCGILASMNVSAQIWDFEGVQKLGGEINTEAEESLPIFSKDSSLLYFIRSFDKRNKGGVMDQDVWRSSKESTNKYGEGKQEASVNTKYNNGVVGLSQDGNTLYLLNAYEGKKDVEKGLAYATKKGSKWGEIIKIEIPGLDIDGDYYGFHISSDEKVIIISYNGPGTVGEEDLYYCIKNGETWSSPVNMGTEINSAGFEMSPFLSPNKDTLFFSSNGHGGLGDADIFYSVKKDSWSSWSKPKNMGNKINSAKFDACFSYSGNTVYWSSNRDADMSDIYTAYLVFPPPLVASCTATNATIFKATNGSVDLKVEGGVAPYSFLWSTGASTEDLLDVGKGEYTVTVKDDYGQEATATCAVDEPAPVVFDPVIGSAFKNLEFMHYFNYNENKLSVSRGDLKKFAKEVEKQLKDGRPKITINVYSSASHVPTTTYESNEVLTKLRAENMKYDLANYFNSKPEFAGKVNVVIVTAIVDGPEYVKDFNDKNKYKPYQFVGLKTE